MIGDLFINNIDAYAACKTVMGDNFIQEILAPGKPKPFVENQDRSQNGKQVLYDDSPKIADRDLTLQIRIEGATPEQHRANLRALTNSLMAGKVVVGIPKVTDEIFRFTYIDSANFALSADRCSSSLAVKFNEPDPSNRGAADTTEQPTR